VIKGQTLPRRARFIGAARRYGTRCRIHEQNRVGLFAFKTPKRECTGLRPRRPHGDALGAAQYLAENAETLTGSVVVIFSSPPKRLRSAGRENVRDGMMDRWGIQEVIWHAQTGPLFPQVSSAFRPRPFFAANTDLLEIEVESAATLPRRHETIDKQAFVTAHIHSLRWQTIVSRNAGNLLGNIRWCPFTRFESSPRHSTFHPAAC